MLMPAHPLITTVQPEHEGHPVGHAFIRCSPLSTFRPEWPILKRHDRPAFEMTSVDYSIYYPCVPVASDQKGVKWVSPNYEAVVRGYKHFLNLGWLSWSVGLLGKAITRVSVPAHDLAPLLASVPGSERRPMVIFSHGLAGTRATYSQYCSALAAAGMVVLAIEHRDGSGPVIMLPDLKEDGGSEGEQEVPYIKLDDLAWPPGHEGSLKEMGEIQLDMRVREIYEAYHHFCHLATEGVDERTTQVGYDLDTRRASQFVKSLRGQMDLDSMYIAGHSFGGGTALHVAQTPPPAVEYLLAMPIKGCIALDPWIELLSDPSPSPTETLPSVPLLCINSPGFTAWTPHFERLRAMLEGGRGTLLTLSGTTHQSFSDFAMLLTFNPAKAGRLLRTIGSLCRAFIDGDLASHPQTRCLQPDKTGRVVKQEGAITLHLLGHETDREKQDIA